MAVYRGEVKLIQKVRLTKNVFEYKFELDSPMDFVPGQFVSVAVKDILRRSYSILSTDDQKLVLVVDISPGGPGSIFFNNLKVGQFAHIMGPLGIFKYKNTNLKKVFVATGTGIVPFIPMIKELLASDANIAIQLFFGTRHLDENLAYKYLDNEIKKANLKMIRCVSQLEGKNEESCMLGRVTKVIPEQISDFSNTEFYLCGVSQMVLDMEALLLEKNVAKENIIHEKYG